MTVVVRADASTEIGTGHVMRCIALVQALHRKGTPSVFVTRTAEGGLLERLRGEACRLFSLEDANTDDVAFTAAVARANKAPWIVVDGYGFGPDYMSALRATGPRVMCIDDLGSGSFECDVVLNQNLHALDASYSHAAHTRLLLGPTYALLREEFTGDIPVDTARASTVEPHILVTLGGADPDNCTLKAVDALAATGIEGAEIRVICGPAFRHGDSVRARASELGMRIEVLTGVADMVQHMLWADRCLTAGGSTCWEYCRLGVPMAVGVIAENQVRVAASIERHGLGIDLGWLARQSTRSIQERLRPWLLDTSALRRAAKAASGWVDGRGADRVAEVLLERIPSHFFVVGRKPRIEEERHD